MMTIEQLYRDECDTIRLLIDEFEHTAAEHIRDNLDAINEVQARDWDEYIPPKVIPNIFGFLTSLLLIHSMSLLEYRLPIIVTHCLKQRGIVVSNPFEIHRKGNILEKFKLVIKSYNDINIDVGDALFERLNAWMRVRNDEVHNGGYRGSSITDHQIKILGGVRAGEVGTLYDIQLVACRNAIDDVEAFFLRVDQALMPPKDS